MHSTIALYVARWLYGYHPPLHVTKSIYPRSERHYFLFCFCFFFLLTNITDTNVLTSKLLCWIAKSYTGKWDYSSLTMGHRAWYFRNQMAHVFQLPMTKKKINKKTELWRVQVWYILLHGSVQILSFLQQTTFCLYLCLKFGLISLQDDLYNIQTKSEIQHLL